MLKELLKIIVVLLGISFISFFLMYLSPTDPVRALFAVSGVVPTDEQLALMRNEMGLDRPFVVQYVDWLVGLLQGDFGMSISRGEPVLDLLVDRLWPTIKLAGLSFVMMLVMSFSLGLTSALNANKFADYFSRTVSFAFISLPSFWVGLILLYVVCLQWQLLPVVSLDGGITSLLLPALTLALAMTGVYARLIRTLVLEEMNQDYVLGARARGISQRTIIVKHVLPNTLLPLITILGLSLGSLLGGTVVVEVIFSYPALGSLALDAISAMDYPLIQGFVLWVALIYLLVNKSVDLLYKKLDPRLKKGG